MSKEDTSGDTLFRLTPEQMKKVDKWIKDHPEWASLKTGAIGGAFTYCFTNTTIGQIQSVEHFKGERLDLTDYSDW